jgi:hypothetical protein
MFLYSTLAHTAPRETLHRGSRTLANLIVALPSLQLAGNIPLLCMPYVK